MPEKYSELDYDAEKFCKGDEEISSSCKQSEVLSDETHYTSGCVEWVIAVICAIIIIIIWYVLGG